jgi:FkbM family methyltransferase
MQPASSTYRGLVRLKEKGFAPTAILDIGAHVGSWARGVRSIFPSAYIFMADALAEKEPNLRVTARDLGNADYAVALLGDEDIPEAPFIVVNAGTDQSGSSKYMENTGFPKEHRVVRQTTLDALLPSGRAFQLVKLDVQGAELDVLRGGYRSLQKTEVILMEVALMQYNRGAPLIADVLMVMRNWGFLLYDVLDEHRSSDDAVLRQIDALFLRSNSRMRPFPPF